MYPQTCRNPRHNRESSNLITAISDYESDAVVANTASYSYEPRHHRTNTELNLSVLQRYLPSVRSILNIAASAVVYTLGSPTGSWDRTGHEGTLFVCALAAHTQDPSMRPRACVFILNRKGLDNVVIDLGTVHHAEMVEELVVLQIESPTNAKELRVVGLWIHNDKEDTRETSWAMIEESWKYARSLGPSMGLDTELGPAARAVGKLSLSGLLSQ